MKEILSQLLFLLIPMDSVQTDHLKAYGVVYESLQRESQVQWLLNYRGGSYMVVDDEQNRQALAKNHVFFEPLDNTEATAIKDKIKDDGMQAAVKLERAPRVAVYAPSAEGHWDDAVMNVLNYTGIPYDVIGDFEVLNKDLKKYDWIHLHHEDFTGQYGRFHYAYKGTPWYTEMVASEEAEARKLGFKKVSQMKLAVAKKLKKYIADGGFLFAMCSATDSYDVALAAEGTDIVPAQFDGDPTDPKCMDKLKYKNTLAFENFGVDTNWTVYEFSHIDTYFGRGRVMRENNDYFELQNYNANSDPQKAMFTQNHQQIIKGFWGMTTGFSLAYIKDDATIMGKTKYAFDEARYISGTYGKGSWCFYSGHDPEDYMHHVGEAAPDISLTPNSAGYRLILNNVLRPAAHIPNAPEQKSIALEVYNNPVRDQQLRLAITLNEPGMENMKGTLRIYDLQGKEMHASEMVAHDGLNTQIMELPEMSAGLYYVQFESGKTVLRKKFIVEK
ncbi:MAG: hypothetical protein FD123_2242 [Bacteroidetes bacterium]|nr:MAG: hypothetical protein FD123_2242 [Bacteroidota bacterium]